MGYTSTTNYGFQKPEKNNAFNINDLNNALDKVDEVIKNIDNKNVEQDLAITGKVNIAQGVENAGKVLGIGNDGNVIVVESTKKLHTSDSLNDLLSVSESGITVFHEFDIEYIYVDEVYSTKREVYSTRVTISSGTYLGQDVRLGRILLSYSDTDTSTTDLTSCQLKMKESSIIVSMGGTYATKLNSSDDIPYSPGSSRKYYRIYI